MSLNIMAHAHKSLRFKYCKFEENAWIDVIIDGSTVMAIHVYNKTEAQMAESMALIANLILEGECSVGRLEKLSGKGKGEK